MPGQRPPEAPLEVPQRRLVVGPQAHDRVDAVPLADDRRTEVPFAPEEAPELRRPDRVDRLAQDIQDRRAHYSYTPFWSVSLLRDGGGHFCRPLTVSRQLRLSLHPGARPRRVPSHLVVAAARARALLASGCLASRFRFSRYSETVRTPAFLRGATNPLVEVDLNHDSNVRDVGVGLQVEHLVGVDQHDVLAVLARDRLDVVALQGPLGFAQLGEVQAHARADAGGAAAGERDRGVLAVGPRHEHVAREQIERVGHRLGQVVGLLHRPVVQGLRVEHVRVQQDLAVLRNSRLHFGDGRVDRGRGRAFDQGRRRRARGGRAGVAGRVDRLEPAERDRLALAAADRGLGRELHEVGLCPQSADKTLVELRQLELDGVAAHPDSLGRHFSSLRSGPGPQPRRIAALRARSQPSLNSFDPAGASSHRPRLAGRLARTRSGPSPWRSNSAVISSRSACRSLLNSSVFHFSNRDRARRSAIRLAAVCTKACRVAEPWVPWVAWTRPETVAGSWETARHSSIACSAAPRSAAIFRWAVVSSPSRRACWARASSEPSHLSAKATGYWRARSRSSSSAFSRAFASSSACLRWTYSASQRCFSAPMMPASLRWLRSWSAGASSMAFARSKTAGACSALAAGAPAAASDAAVGSSVVGAGASVVSAGGFCSSLIVPR